MQKLELKKLVEDKGFKNQIVKSIHIHWCEGFISYPEDETFSLEEANDWLETISNDMGWEGGYNKVKFTATLHNGEEYVGLFDVWGAVYDQGNQFNKLCFYAHMLSHILYIEDELWLGYLTTPPQTTPESPTTDDGGVSVTLSQNEIKFILGVLGRDLTCLKEVLKFNLTTQSEVDHYLDDWTRIMEEFENKLK